MRSNKLILIRGLPGSGKSTMAKKLAEAKDHYHLEADMYHMNDSVYDWKPENVKASHEWCQRNASQALVDGYNVVVSNTFTQLKELRPYLEMWANIEIIDCYGDYGNVHNVPKNSIERMKNRWISKTKVEFIEYVNKWKKL